MTSYQQNGKRSITAKRQIKMLPSLKHTANSFCGETVDKAFWQMKCSTYGEVVKQKQNPERKQEFLKSYPAGSSRIKIYFKIFFNSRKDQTNPKSFRSMVSRWNSRLALSLKYGRLSLVSVLRIIFTNNRERSRGLALWNLPLI